MERNLRDPKRRAMMESDALYEVERQGGAEGLVIMGFPDKALVGKTLGQVAREKGLSVFDAVLWLARNGLPDRLGGVTWSMRAVGMVDIEEWMRHDWNGVSLDRGVDDLASCEPFTHPGTWGTSGRLIETFVKQRKTITLPYAIRSLTSVGAQALGLRDRGLLREGMMADVVVFDLEQMGTDATYLEPCKAQRGVEWLVVNGKLAVADGRFGSEYAGRLISKNPSS